MTPPLIDHRGFVLGRVNVIDGLAVQFTAAIAVVGVAFVAPDFANHWVTLILTADLIALWGLSRAPEPTAANDPEGTSNRDGEPTGAAGATETDDSEPTVILEVPSDVNVRVRNSERADTGREVER
ncbi:hypothetical protein [Halorussus amylolyticus]|uniref:hypothetical protein n=1 Tax=Halorussus amylolyticus TaxID=1126242 RepID=UPI00104801FF|nr:hypothetical protein [Halorussus amylolyticus]